MKRGTYRLTSKAQRERLCRHVMAAPADWLGVLSEPTRSLDQNAKLWPMLEDIRDQVPDMQAYGVDDIKMRFLHALGAEMRFLPELEGQGMFPIGLRSSTLTVAQFSGLVELIYAFGAKHGVVWSEPKQ